MQTHRASFAVGLALVVLVPVGIAYGLGRATTVPGTRASCLDWAAVTVPATTTSTSWTNVPGMSVKDTLAQNFAVQMSGTFEGDDVQIRVIDASIGGTSALAPGVGDDPRRIGTERLIVHVGRPEPCRTPAHVPTAMAAAFRGERDDVGRRCEPAVPGSADALHVLSVRRVAPFVDGRLPVAGSAPFAAYTTRGVAGRLRTSVHSKAACSCPSATTSVTSPSWLTSTTARPRSWTPCSGSPGRSARTRT